MSQPSTINPRIIEGLYCEALALSDEVRATLICQAVSAGRGMMKIWHG